MSSSIVRSRCFARTFGIPVAAVIAALLGASISVSLEGCSDNCEIKQCSEFGENTNGRSFTKCYYGVAPMETVIEDEQGNEVYDCTDGSEETCTEATVNAEFAYCEVQ